MKDKEKKAWGRGGKKKERKKKEKKVRRKCQRVVPYAAVHLAPMNNTWKILCWLAYKRNNSKIAKLFPLYIRTYNPISSLSIRILWNDNLRTHPHDRIARPRGGYSDVVCVCGRFFYTLVIARQHESGFWMSARRDHVRWKMTT